SPALARADVCADAQANVPLPLEVGPCADVLAQEARWLTAITAGDRATVESILGPTFKHVNSEGQLVDRAKEVDGTIPLPFTMNPSEQIVDIAGDAAVIHGVNTLIQNGKVRTRERFTDVFVLQDGVWKALSAQETTL
ncbi:MAG TPA: nuclear transport factor 2 family protein, partial [Mycobacterium sp.]|nr:nuclear transport factor 2 family protein [Mycobacterium sp.]